MSLPDGITLDGQNPALLRMFLRRHRIDLVVTSAAGRGMDRAAKRLRLAGVRFLMPVHDEDDDEHHTDPVKF